MSDKKQYNCEYVKRSSGVHEKWAPNKKCATILYYVIFQAFIL